MAPNLPAWKTQAHSRYDNWQITDISQIADAAGCSERSITTIRSNPRLYGTVRASSNGAGRCRNITPFMLRAICNHLREYPGLYLDEMVTFLQDKFHLIVTPCSISRAFVSVGWLKKVIKHIARMRNADLRDFYLYNLSAFRSYHLVYVDESGCDKWVGSRGTG